MKKIKSLNLFCALYLLSAMLITAIFVSCDDGSGSDGDSENTRIASFLDTPQRQKTYSEFSALLKKAGMYDLLNSKDAMFTCFIPSNQAIQEFYQKNNTSLEEMSDSEITYLVNSHIISYKEPFLSTSFPLAPIPASNLNKEQIEVLKNKDGDFIVNDLAKILAQDFLMENGVIHTIDKVLKAYNSSVDKTLKELPEFSIFYEALKKTGMIDSLYLTENQNYVYKGKLADQKLSGNGELMETPSVCKYGYTVFMESNQTLAKENINSIEELITYAENIYYDLFPLPEQDAERIKSDYTNRKNGLNRFVSYHMMDRMLDINEFINPLWVNHFTENTIIREYIEMMMPNSMIEIQSGNLINKSEGSIEGDKDIKIEKRIANSENVIFHEITNLLTYDNVEATVLNKRLRIDVASIVTEFATNKYRGDRGTGYPYLIIPPNYFGARSKMSFFETTQFQYIGNKSWFNMYGDEFLFVGKYDFHLTTPPIPAGEWEVRLGYTANRLRGMAQIFLDGEPCGIPVDFRLLGPGPEINWRNDSETEDDGENNDKIMRNNGYLKGPSSIINASNGISLRNISYSLRKIIGNHKISESRPVILRIKSVLDDTNQEFMIDYLEFVPVHYLENEKRD